MRSSISGNITVVKLAVAMRPPVAAEASSVEVKDDASEVIAEAAE
jgi:hypothetical protein